MFPPPSYLLGNRLKLKDIISVKPKLPFVLLHYRITHLENIKTL